jgi:hypothetical protein
MYKMRSVETSWEVFNTHEGKKSKTVEEFDAAYQRLKEHGIAVTEVIARSYGKTFYFQDPNGIRLQIEVKTKQTADSLEGAPDPVPYMRTLLQRA